MCQSCGCSPCEKCGRVIDNGCCVGCGKESSQCDCAPEKEESSLND